MNSKLVSTLDLSKRAILPIAAAILLVLSLIEGWWWLAVLMAAVVALGLYDGLQSRWTITRNYPVAGRIRWLFYNLRPYLHSYIVEPDIGGTPFSLAAQRLVHARADTSTRFISRSPR